MKERLDILKPHALSAANEVKGNDDCTSERAEKAYSLARSFSEEICPKCWVKSEGTTRNTLEVDAYAKKEDIYKCQVCDFTVFFPKQS
jgi:hypothetical protein